MAEDYSADNLLVEIGRDKGGKLLRDHAPAHAVAIATLALVTVLMKVETEPGSRMALCEQVAETVRTSITKGVAAGIVTP